MNDFKNPWEAEKFVNPWEVGGGLSVLDRDKQPKLTQKAIVCEEGGIYLLESEDQSQLKKVNIALSNIENKALVSYLRRMQKTKLGQDLWIKYINSKTDAIFIFFGKGVGGGQSGVTQANIESLGGIVNGKISRTQINLNGIDVNKLIEKIKDESTNILKPKCRIHTIAFDPQIIISDYNSTVKVHKKEKSGIVEEGAETIYHEIKFHIDWDVENKITKIIGDTDAEHILAGLTFGGSSYSMTINNLKDELNVMEQTINQLYRTKWEALGLNVDTVIQKAKEQGLYEFRKQIIATQSTK